MTTTPGSRAPARSGRRTMLVAAAGYGKTAALEAQGAVIRRAADLLADTGTDPLPPVLGIDDVHELGPADQVRLLALLDRPAGPREVWLSGRLPLASQAKRTVRWPLPERGPADLALSLDGVARVLRDEHGVTDTQVADTVHGLTAGWPALVQLAGDAAARGLGCDQVAAALTDAGGETARWVTDEVLASVPPRALATLRRLAGLPLLTPALAAQVASAAAEPDLDLLCRVGLVVDGRVVPVVAAALGDEPVPAGVLATAAAWYESHRHPLAAATAYARCGQPAIAAAVVRAHGADLLAGGAAEDVAALLADAGLRAGDAQLQLLYADALRSSGDAASARRAYAPLLEAATAAGHLDPGLARRLAELSYMCGDHAEAAQWARRAVLPEPAVEAEEVLLLACRARLLGVTGEPGAERQAALAVRGAELLDDDRVLASAHLAAAVATSGTLAAGHLAQARRACERAGDLAQLSVVAVNESYTMLAAARYDQAAAAAREAVAAGRRGAPSGRVVTALHNLGEALTRQGMLDDAELAFRRAVDLAHRKNLRRTGFGHLGLAELCRLRGRREQGIAAYQEALTAARDSGETQVLVPALAGLARLLLDPPSDVDRAGELAAEALARSGAETSTYALTASGYAALAKGEREQAAGFAERALQAARAAGLVDALAEALELAGIAHTDPARAAAALREALAIWVAGGASASADRIQVLLGGLPGADGPSRGEARAATRRLMRLGLLPDATLADADRVTVTVIGGFEVRVGGVPVPLPAWRSRQARTLVKLFAARRGRPLARAELCELLWPDDDPTKTAHRLSVLLNAVRQVLDPARRLPPDHYLTADQWGVGLDLRHVTLDVDQLFEDCGHATALLAGGDAEAARETLHAVVARHQGEAFEDEPYEAWAQATREEVRSAWSTAARRLAAALARAGQPHDACGLFVRLLSLDPYDESAHSGLVRLLVRTGRHGEARRAFQRWTEAMADIDAPAPDPDLLSPAPALAPNVVLIPR